MIVIGLSAWFEARKMGGTTETIAPSSQIGMRAFFIGELVGTGGTRRNWGNSEELPDKCPVMGITTTDWMKERIFPSFVGY